VVSVLAIGPKVRGFESGREGSFLRVTQILSTTSFEGEVKPSVPCKILKHVKESYEHERDTPSSSLS
jgi:hypothetical protein